MGGVFIENNKKYAIFPLEIIYDDKYKDLSSKELLLYMLMLNRANISKSNLTHFSDKNGIFIYYSNDQITKDIRCNKSTASIILDNLEKVGLIRKEYQKRGLPLKIYVNDICTENKSTYSAVQTPQDKFSQKSYSNSIYNKKPHTDHSAEEEKQVSFDVKKALTQKQINRRNFGNKKRKKTEIISQSS